MGQHGGPQPQFYRCTRRVDCFGYIGFSGMQGIQHICIGPTRLNGLNFEPTCPAGRSNIGSAAEI